MDKIQKKREYFKQYYQDNKEYFRQRHLDGYHKEYRKNNKKEIKKYNIEYNDINRLRYRNHHLKNTYNITLEDYNKLFIKQKGKCAICGEHQRDLKNTLSVDHNHETGIVRGLLCHHCNVALGYAREDIDILLNMISYLRTEIEALSLQTKNNE